MFSFKGFDTGLICRGYRFRMGLNKTEKANCVANGFHSAENPLDCLTYYPNVQRSEYYLVECGGDIDEDGCDSKIACTELTIHRRLSMEEFLLYGLMYMMDHPHRPWSPAVRANSARANGGFAVVRGKNPVACGAKGDLLALAKEERGSSRIERIALIYLDGKDMKPYTWYDIDSCEKGGVKH